jgi:hypothetical protein
VREHATVFVDERGASARCALIDAENPRRRHGDTRLVPRLGPYGNLPLAPSEP